MDLTTDTEGFNQRYAKFETMKNRFEELLKESNDTKEFIDKNLTSKFCMKEYVKILDKRKDEKKLKHVKDSQIRLNGLNSIEKAAKMCFSDHLINTIKRKLNTGEKFDLDKHDSTGLSVLHTVIHLETSSYKICEIINLLISKGATINRKDNYNRTALHHAAMILNNVKILQTLFDLGLKDLSVKDYECRTALHYAIDVPYVIQNDKMEEYFNFQIEQIPCLQNLIWFIQKEGDKDKKLIEIAIKAENPFILKYLWDVGIHFFSDLEYALASNKDLSPFLIELFARNNVSIEQIIGSKRVFNDNPHMYCEYKDRGVLFHQFDYENFCEIAYNCKNLSLIAKDWYNSIYDAVETGEYKVTNHPEILKKEQEEMTLRIYQQMTEKYEKLKKKNVK